MSYGPPPGFTPPPFGYGPPPMGPPQGPPGAPPPNPMNPYPMDPMGGGGGGGYGMPPRNHGLAVASLVCGILALFPGCCCGIFGTPLSVAALVMGIISINQINASGGQLGGKNMALAGTICGGVAVAINVVGLLFNVSSEVMRTLHV